MSDKMLLLADEAVAQAALDAGLTGAYAYPGTPSTEILEYIQGVAARTGRRVHYQWSANEKTAMEEAMGVAFAGRRALAAMKHVGLNVAADPFINAAVTGVNGGLVVAACDDPSMHSSQNEQDSRFFARFALVPCLEPATQQEAYDMVRAAFDLSEAHGVPIVVRLVTRLAHSRADVTVAPARAENPVRLPTDRRQYVLLPVNARRNYDALVAKQPRLLELAETSPWNSLTDGPDHSLGVIAAGIGYNYLREVFGQGPVPYPVLKLCQYPLPVGLIRQLAARCRTLLVIEDGMPLVEEAVRGVLETGVRVRGRLDGSLPRTGELSPDAVMAALGQTVAAPHRAPEFLAARPPRLCQGCAHAGTFTFLKAALQDQPDTRVFSDIGCYTLAALPPFQAIDTCVCMGASVTMAKGAADAGYRPALAVIGDSTFMHSGITGLLDCVVEHAPVTIMILDNDVTAMTGGQVSMGSEGRLERICLGLGVEPAHLRVVDPLPKNAEENAAVLRQELAYEGVSVIISRRVCIQAHKARTKDKAKE